MVRQQNEQETIRVPGNGESLPAGRNPDRERLLAAIPVRERRRMLAGMSTAVLEGGDGPPIILLHGPGVFALWWMRVIPELLATHQVIAPDLPGHGATGVPDGPLDTAVVFAWLEDLIEQTCASRPVLVGHALGGAIAARFAATRGDGIDRLVLVDALGLGPFRPTPGFALELMRYLVRPSRHTYWSFLAQCLYDPDHVREQMGEQWEPFLTYQLDGARNPRARTALRILMQKVGVPVIPPETLARIPTPTALIWGQHDCAVRLGIAEAVSTRHGWPLYVIEDARDNPKFEQPKAFMRALRAALAESAAPSPIPGNNLERRQT